MSRRPPHLRALVRSAAPTRDIPPDVRARSAKRVAKLAAVPFALSVWSAWGKAALAAALVGAVGAAGLVALRAPTSPTVTPARRTAPARTAPRPVAATPSVARAEARALATPPPAPAPTPVARALVHAPVERAVTARTAPERTAEAVVTPVAVPPSPRAASDAIAPSMGLAAAHPSAHDGLLGELALVSEAQAALVRDPEAVLAIAARHRAEYPGGHLLEESEFLSLDALHRLGRREAFAARADDFLRAHPRGPYAERVRRWIVSHNGD